MYNKSKKFNTDITVCSANTYNINTKISEFIPFVLETKYLPNKDIFNYEDIKEKIFNIFQNWNWNKISKRDFIEKYNIRFQEIYRTNDLYFTCIALVLAKRITIVEEPLVNYRIGMSNNSQQTNHLHPLDFWKAFLELKRFLKEQNIYAEVSKSYTNHAIASCLYNFRTISNLKMKKYLINEVKCNNYNIIDLDYFSKDIFSEEYIYDDFVSYFIDNIPYKNFYDLLEKYKSEKIIFWGASGFLWNFLKYHDLSTYDIFGIVDINPAKCGQKLENYLIYSLNQLDNECKYKVILTIKNDNITEIYENVKKELMNFSNIELLPNIFEEV